MTTKDALGDRMKRYEAACHPTLPPRLPVILRIDGRAFHTFTRGMERPFDEDLMATMERVGKALCSDACGAQFAYVQSDEISVLIHTYKRFASQAWFGNEVQKMVSVAASVASSMLTLAYQRHCSFDARVFVLPEADVCNYFIWRQQDAMRSSVQMVARSLYPHSECEYKNQNALRNMCLAKGVDWSLMEPSKTRGRCVVRRTYEAAAMAPVGPTLEVRETSSGTITRSEWVVDDAIPVFSEQRDYIEKHLATEEE